MEQVGIIIVIGSKPRMAGLFTKLNNQKNIYLRIEKSFVIPKYNLAKRTYDNADYVGEWHGRHEQNLRCYPKEYLK